MKNRQTDSAHPLPGQLCVGVNEIPTAAAWVAVGTQGGMATAITLITDF